jgi:hypothetical protein
MSRRAGVLFKWVVRVVVMAALIYGWFSQA